MRRLHLLMKRMHDEEVYQFFFNRICGSKYTVFMVFGMMLLLRTFKHKKNYKRLFTDTRFLMYG